MFEAEKAIQRVLDLCADWDKLSKGETSTTKQIRDAINNAPEFHCEVCNSNTHDTIGHGDNRPVNTDPGQPTLFGEPCD